MKTSREPRYSKLTSTQASIIKGLSRLKLPVTIIARQFPTVRYQAVYNTVTGKTWKHVEPAPLFIADDRGTRIEIGAGEVTC